MTLRQKEKFMVAAIMRVLAKEAMLIHKRLGHPSFTLLKMMYPSLFKNCSINDLVCNVCQLAKLKRNTYPLEQNRCLKPFQLIHCDIWGPSSHIALKSLCKTSHRCVKPCPYTISSFQRFAHTSPTYKNFFITLNQISIPKVVD